VYLIRLVQLLLSTMSTFRKFVLMSRNELDRIKERKIREYDQGLSALVRTEKDIEELLSDPTISNDEKLQSYYKLSEKFEKLRPIKTTQIPGTTTLAPINQSEATPPATEQEDAMDELEAPEAATDTPPLEPAAAMVALQAQQPPATIAALQAQPLPNQPPILNEVNLPPQYHNKYSQLKTLIDLNPNIIRSSPNGEIVINNRILVDSSYNDLIRESYIHSLKHNIIGLPQFLQALNVIHADPSLISNNIIISKYKKLIPKRNSIPIQFASGPPGKRPRTIIIYRK